MSPKTEGNMGSWENEIRELSALVKETSDQIFEDHYSNFSDLLHRAELSEQYGPVPLEVWTGVAQALPDTSGYRIVLQAEILEPISDAPNTYRIVGHREIASADPSLWLSNRGG
jgi:hypothetical protein